VDTIYDGTSISTGKPRTKEGYDNARKHFNAYVKSVNLEEATLMHAEGVKTMLRQLDKRFV
jgi:hypothetical protein